MNTKRFKALLLLLFLAAGKSNPELEMARNYLDLQTENALFPECGPSGFQCVGPSIYKSCNNSKKKLHFCQSGTVCEDTGFDICISKPPPCMTEGRFLIPGFCNKFYFCVRTGSQIKQYIGSCEPGFEFSLATGNCTLPLDADCSVKKVVGTDVKQSMGADRRTESELTGGKFVCKSPGLFADPLSCRHYYMCVKNWFPILGGGIQTNRLRCPYILPNFNKEKQLCWFYDDNCVESM